MSEFSRVDSVGNQSNTVDNKVNNSSVPYWLKSLPSPPNTCKESGVFSQEVEAPIQNISTDQVCFIFVFFS